MSGDTVEIGEDTLPTRAEMAQIYKFFRLENTCGRTLFNLRALRTQLGERLGCFIDGFKLRVMVRMLDDMKVCSLDEQENDYFYLEVCKNASKTNIEEAATYKKLKSLLAD